MWTSLDFVIALTVIVQVASSPADKKLLLILVDGLRWDFVDLYHELELPGFRRLFKDGVVADYMIPIFPTVSFPNYFSIMTGQYAENHGVIGNYMYDQEHGTRFEIFGTQKEQYYPYWYDEAEPLWVRAEKRKLRTSWYYWPGTEVTIRGIRPFHVTPYNQFVPTVKEHLDGALQSALEDFLYRNVSIAGVHMLKLDDRSHYQGFTSESAQNSLLGIDRLLLELILNIERKNMADKINLLVFSDHGHIDIPRDHFINISEVLDDKDVHIKLGEGPTVFLWPEEEKTEKVFDALKNFHPRMRVHKKNEIPERFHFRKHHRIPPILLVADLPWSIIYEGSILFKPKVGYISNHGYDNQEVEMRAMFAAKGPGFKQNYRAKPFENVCLYDMMCRLLGIPPAKNNGTWADVKDMLSESVFGPTEADIHKSQGLGKRAGEL